MSVYLPQGSLCGDEREECLDYPDARPRRTERLSRSAIQDPSSANRMGITKRGVPQDLAVERPFSGEFKLDV